MSVPTLGEVVEVADTETVVRLDGRAGRLGELVVTGDVGVSLAEVLEAAAKPGGHEVGGLWGAGGRSGTESTAAWGGGAGFFVVGPFGSGKSHFLAALGELLRDPASLPGLGWGEELRSLAAGARRSLPVAVPLVEYRAEARLEDVVSERAWRALGATSRAPRAGDERTASWDAFLSEATRAGWEGVVLLVDELSEWLRAKQGPSLTEDLRFLQFLGEWAQQRPVVVAAALQESIEEVANVSQRELARIRDRYRPSLKLSMRHVEDLVQGRLVQLRPGAERWVRQAHAQASSAFPASAVSFEVFSRCYPLHPETLSVLEGLRFLLSQQRGVVDFVCRSVRAALGRPCTELVTPDLVYDHFAGRLAERPETAKLAAGVVAYYERALEELVDPEDRSLALRALKLMCLLSASPLERPRSAAELTWMLQARVSDLDPSANVAYLEAAVLEPMVKRGAYVVCRPGPPTTYEVDAGADAALVFAARVSQARAELNPADRRLVHTLAELGSTPSLPLSMLAQLGISRRELLWQNTLRSLLVGTVRAAELTAEEADATVAQARAAGAEACLLVAEPELSEADVEAAIAAATAAAGRTGRIAVWVPAKPTEEELDALLDLHARRAVLAEASRDGLADLVEVGEASAESGAALARELLRRLYFEGSVAYPPVADRGRGADFDLPSLAGFTFERQLPRLADPLLSGLHPLHRQVAPRGELVGERLLRRLVHEAIAPGRLPPGALAAGQLRPLVEGYLVPLGLARSRRDGADIAPDPARSPAVAELLRLVGDGGRAASEVVAALGEGPLGLTEVEALLVLNACVRAGLVEMLRGRKAVAEPFLAVMATDRLMPGELVAPVVRERIERLGPVVGPGPFDPWTAATQRQAWQYARAWAEARREELAQVYAGLQALEGLPALAGAQAAGLAGDAEQLRPAVEAVSGTASPASGLEALAAAAADPESLLAASRRISAAARFFRDDLRRLEQEAEWLTHPDLEVPPDDPRLLTLVEGARRLLGEAVRLAAEDRAGEVFAAAREARSAYLAAYQAAHDRHHSTVPPGRTAGFRASAPYRALAALAAAGAPAVPDDLVKLDRALSVASPAPCTRRVDQELVWKPLCACGFRLGDQPPVFDEEALSAMAKRGVAEHLAELARPELLERLGSAAADLEALGRSELARDLRRLVELAAPFANALRGAPGTGAAGPSASAEAAEGPAPVPSASAAVPSASAPVPSEEIADLLGEELQRTLREVLAGAQLIVTRDLALLREDLIGRRYPKRRLLELLGAWADPTGEVPMAGYIEVVDSAETGHGSGGASRQEDAASSPTVAFLRAHFPSLASQLPSHHGAEAFWLAAWWAGAPPGLDPLSGPDRLQLFGTVGGGAGPPPWVPARLLSEATLLQAAAEAALRDPGALADLADLDRRAQAGTLLGGQVAARLGLANRSAGEVASVLAGERLLREPLRLGAEQLLRRLAGDWQLAERLEWLDLEAVVAGHPLVSPGDLEPLALCFEAARHLVSLERGVGAVSPVELVEVLYPTHYAPVPGLLSRAERLASTTGLVDAGAIGDLRCAADRLLSAADRALQAAADEGFPGCLALWQVGDQVVSPLLKEHERVAVLVVDAMRVDLAERLLPALSTVLPGREIERRFAVLPAPTRTAEALAALSSGAPAPAGSNEPSCRPVPFSHLGYEVAVVLGADRDHAARDLRKLWVEGPPVSVAVATGLDERLHRTSVEVAALLEEAVALLERRVLPSLSALPSSVPLVVLADHGFRENPAWGRGPEGRYVHGGTSLEECVVPVLLARPAR